MSIDKLLRIKIWSKVLLIVSVVLFLIGIGVKILIEHLS